MWCVVFFLDDDTYEVIPNIWVCSESKELTYFPNVEGFKLYEIIKNRTIPAKEWPIYKINVLAEYADFHYAQVQCEEARCGNVISNNDESNSQQINAGKGQRVRKPNIKLSEYTSLNTDDEELGISTSFRKIDHKKSGSQTTADLKQNLTEHDASSSKDDGDATLTRFPRIDYKSGNLGGNKQTTGVAKVIAMCDDNENNIILNNMVEDISYNTKIVDNISLIVTKLEEITLKNEEFQRRMFRQQFIIQNKLADLESLIVTLSTTTDKTKETTTDEQVILEIWKLFPLANTENLNIVEQTLLDNTLFKDVARKFSLVGGDTAKEITRNILYLMLTNDFAANYSFDGAKGKLKFKSLKLYELLLASIRSNLKTENATESDILPELRQWLAQAKFRKRK
ncbi:hypothetical protein PPYR_12253 [Photinus pyralis]|uniref:Uncharacterized protein n=1 Tax=Photinus pyralis TaxID=7054 RepID=A0A5N4ADM2_PHOPY|nr:uncharacterized protein LOC116177356 isoform X2 [Photinus pyralis]KAB0795414.1 hypothetical protein PPYR_12253 [Photinus pyralis]